jgi:hypothetical protein
MGKNCLMTQKKKYGFYVLLALTSWACMQIDPWQKVDLPKQLSPVKIERLDTAVFFKEPLADKNKRLQAQFGQAYENYFVYMMGISYQDEYAEKALEYLTEDSLQVEIYQETQKVFPNLDALAKNLSAAFFYLKYYFPNDTLPAVYVVHDGMKYNPLVDAKNIYISLGFYLGKDNALVQKLSYPDYFKVRMDKDYLLSDALLLYLTAKYYPDSQDKEMNFLQTVVNAGKLLYLLDLLLPYTADYLKIKYTQSQYQWAKAHEKDTWQYILQNGILYSNETWRINQWVVTAPFTAEYSNESPDRLGEYLGWQMVRHFVRQNPTISPQEVLQTEAIQILKYYKN